MVKLQKELTELGYHFSVFLDGESLYSNITEEEWPQLYRMIGSVPSLVHSVMVGNDDISVIKCSFYENGQECVVVAFSNAGENIAEGQNYFQRHVIPYIWIFGIGTLLVIILVNACCSRWISSLIIPPMKEIRRGMQKIRRGELEGEITVFRQDELGEVSSEFNEMQRQLKLSKEEQAKYEAYRKELISSISHDLRTPLTTIKGYIRGILDGIANTDEKRLKYLLAVQTRTEDLENLINQLSAYNRMETHNFQYKMEKVRLEEFISEYLEENGDFILKNHLEFSVTAGGTEYIRMDRGAMKRVLDNLIINSIRYREKETGKIQIRIERRERRICLSLTDDGPGVGENDLERIFESFCRLDQSRSRCGEGSGLGLAIVKRIITDHQGQVYAKNNNGLESFRKGGYQAVILDLMLPGMNGFDVCKAIRKDSDVPILLVTARKEDIDKIKGLGLGADDYVVKPFSPVELIARVKAHIQIHRKLKTGERENFIQAGPLAIYPDSYLAYKNNRPLELTGREFELLLFLARNPNIVFSKERLFDHIWGMEAVGDISTVTVHINKLRDKIEDDPSEPQFIKTVWGVGYRFQKGRG